MVYVILFILILALLLLSRCKKPVKPGPIITEVSLSVPYQKVQGKDWCIPASAVMVFSYYDENTYQAIIASKIIVNSNASTFKLVSYARELGFVSARVRISINEREDYLRKSIPLIVIQKYSTAIRVNHCRVITGFDSVKHELTLHDSVGKSNYNMSYSAFFALGFDSSKMSQIIVIRR